MYSRVEREGFGVFEMKVPFVVQVASNLSSGWFSWKVMGLYGIEMSGGVLFYQNWE